MDTKIIRFIIIALPPVSIQKEINRLREEISQVGECYSSLKYPPHITMRTGSLVPETEIDNYFNLFEKHIEDTRQIEVKTQGIKGGLYQDGESSKHYIYYSIELSSELQKLHDKLGSFELYKKRIQKNYHPHLTLAFDDLSAQSFEQVYYALESKFSEAPDYIFPIDSIDFYVYTGEKWVEYRSFKL